MSKKIILGIVLIALVSIVAGAGFLRPLAKPPAYTGPVEKITIGVSQLVPELSALFFIAQDRGYFRENGIEAELKPILSSVEIVQEVNDKKIKLGAVTDFTFVADSFTKKDLRIIANVGKINIATIIARSDHGINKPEDLRGKKIAVIPKTTAEYFLDTWLISNNLSPKEVTIVPTKGAELRSSLVEGKVDAILLTRKIAKELEQELKEKIIYWSVQGDQNLHLMLIAHKDDLPARKETFKRLISAMIQAENYLITNQADSLEIMGENLPAQDKDYLASDIGSYNFGVSFEHELILSLEDQARWIIKNVLAGEEAMPNFLNFIYFDALEAVKPEVVTIIHK